jgi:hypothetical protein
MAVVVACTGSVQQYDGPFKSVVEVPNPEDVQELTFLNKTAEFIAEKITEDAPNESLFCLYGEMKDKEILVDVVVAGDFKSTPTTISTPVGLPAGCIANDRYLGTLHTHPLWQVPAEDAERMNVPLCEFSANDYRTFLADKDAGIALVLCANGYMACQLRSGRLSVIQVF